MQRSAADHAAATVGAVLDDPAARFALMRRLYEDVPRQEGVHLPYRRAALAFMAWQLRRGLLNPADAQRPGSPWWRAINERLLRDICEARAIHLGHNGIPSNRSVLYTLDFVRRPTARSWYRAHNSSVVAAYLEHERLARAEGRVERFFINLVLIRVLYAHALVAAPRLALGWLSPVAPLLGDPRLGMTGIFLSLSRVLPARYPLDADVETYVRLEHGFGHLLDVGVIVPRIERLYAWSADTLERPELRGLLDRDVPVYAWDATDHEPWHPAPSALARWARRAVPPGGRRPGGTSA
ncbi:hypothetical protein NDR87_21580 [Nocardia sp. CDC159]|uniref:Uncharacterized protein n=1 Tax=Nocardia pulmonis TaxID=2951408 RepID=A0A9X2EC93_9NOCA|nr:MULTISPECIES: hypothetical protein [Nocardia]MCM6776538.1 hypothetical protein [Nocardia pulmonis]MCM6788962.1 hypothetical protein [Nocardia sp. CDC159]